MMPNPQEPLSLTLIIETSPGVDAERLERWTRQLRTELRELNVGTVDLATNPAAPAGAKAVDAFSLGTLTMNVLPSLLPALLAYMQQWLTRTQDRTIKIKTQRGDQSVEVEFNRNAVSHDELESLVQSLMNSLS